MQGVELDGVKLDFASLFFRLPSSVASGLFLQCTQALCFEKGITIGAGLNGTRLLFWHIRVLYSELGLTIGAGLYGVDLQILWGGSFDSNSELRLLEVLSSVASGFKFRSKRGTWGSCANPLQVLFAQNTTLRCSVTQIFEVGQTIGLLCQPSLSNEGSNLVNLPSGLQSADYQGFAEDVVHGLLKLRGGSFNTDSETSVGRCRARCLRALNFEINQWDSEFLCQPSLSAGLSSLQSFRV